MMMIARADIVSSFRPIDLSRTHAAWRQQKATSNLNLISGVGPPLAITTIVAMVTTMVAVVRPHRLA